MAKQSQWGQWFEEKVFKPLEDKKMPVMEHLHEFQRRLTRAVVVMALVFVGTFFYADTLVTWLRVPLQNYFILDSWEWVPSDLPKIPWYFSPRLKPRDHKLPNFPQPIGSGEH